MNESIQSMLNVSAKNLASSYYWLEKKETSAEVEACRLISLAEDLVRDAIDVLQRKGA